MYFIPMGIFIQDFAGVAGAGANLNWMGFLGINLLPVTIGNVIGGVFFVAVLYWYAYLQGKKE
jgi:formate/nitrite transporter FocA (FNT family)